MKPRIINFLKKYPELLYDILQMQPEILIYDVEINNVSVNYTRLTTNKGIHYLIDEKNIGIDYSFISRHGVEIQKYFNSKFSKTIEIKLNESFSFKELEDRRIEYLERDDENDYERTYNPNKFWSNQTWSKGPWTIKIIEKFKDKWEWPSLSRNQSLPLTIEMVEKFEDKWDWKHGLAWHKNLPKEEEFKKKYWRRCALRLANIPLNELKNDAKVFSIDDLRELACNEIIKWDNELIRTLFTNNDERVWGNLSRNKTLPWSIDFIEEYEKNWEFKYGGLSQNISLPWTEELLDKYFDKWGWDEISSNSSVPWTKELIDKYQYKIDFGRLSSNENVPWDIDLLEYYKYRWDWDKISEQENFPWSKLLIEKYHDKIKWHGATWENREGDKQFRLPGIVRNKKMILDAKMLLFFKNNWKLNSKEQFCVLDTVSLYYILNLDLVENYFELFDPNYLIENNSILSFSLIEIIEKKLGRDKFLEFLEIKHFINSRGTISNKEKIWHKILRHHFNEEVLLEVIKLETL